MGSRRTKFRLKAWASSARIKKKSQRLWKFGRCQPSVMSLEPVIASVCSFLPGMFTTLGWLDPIHLFSVLDLFPVCYVSVFLIFSFIRDVPLVTLNRV